MLSFYTPNNLIEDDRFSKIHYNTTFQDSALNGASVTPQKSTSAMFFLLLIVGNEFDVRVASSDIMFR